MPGAGGTCWACGGDLPVFSRFITPAGPVLAQPGNELHPHHFDRLAGERLDQPLGRIESHPHFPGVLGLMNLSTQPWQGQLSSGERLPIAPGKSCNLASLTRLDTDRGTLALVR
jgi:hypothetical protein